MSGLRVPSSPWCETREEIVSGLTPSGTASGLTESEVAERKLAFGPNALAEQIPPSWWSLLFRQLRSLVVALLAAAALLSGIFGDWVECLAILAVIAINTAIGFFTELKAMRSMDALRRLTESMATVRRGGQMMRINATDLVPGDLVSLEAGDLVPVDLRLLQASQLQVDESALTGESVPVEKQTDSLPADTLLPDRSNMVFKSTPVTRGAALGVATATGPRTEIGQIGMLVAGVQADEQTPLDQRLNVLARRLVWVTLATVLLTGALGIWAGKETYLMIQTSIALAVAAIPEGLPVVATIALARGMWMMASRNALINRLSAVETLGSTSIICTDKTGTLTENRMTLMRMVLPSGEVELGKDEQLIPTGENLDPTAVQDALTIATLCNDASIDPEGKGIGDPLEVALLLGAQKAGIDRDKLESQHPRLSETAFDSDVKMMATLHHEGAGNYLFAIKGAAEPVVSACSDLTGADRELWLERNQSLAAKGLRVIALAKKTVRNEDEPPYADLEFVGLVGLLDPPRKDIAAALEKCTRAGIRVIMMTGDQAATAMNVAQRVGLPGTRDPSCVIEASSLGDGHISDDSNRDHVLAAAIFSRVTPRQKLDIVELHQQQGGIVAMTGDGVNDAPALRTADIGIAMGQRGTEVAREASDMILRDDRFSSIVEAVAQGRVIFGNIRKFVVYLMSCNLSEILVIGIGAALADGLPMLPLQILFLNLVTDVFPALALGAGRGDPSAMQQPPRPSGEPVLRRREWTRIVSYSIVLAAAVLGAYQFASRSLGFDDSGCVTVAFLVLAFAQLWHVFNIADSDEVLRNRYVWMALGLCTILILTAYLVAPLAAVMGLVPIGASGWSLVMLASLAPLTIHQLWRKLT
ncbi:MAG: HAD-IC family P-type ATPase [Verrucomicrobiales bacterium]|nr:HAD-IC family P-type ATPase [Verrucomicrobiales bacterium]